MPFDSTLLTPDAPSQPTGFDPALLKPDTGDFASELTDRFNQQMLAGDVGRQNQSMAESHEGLGRVLEEGRKNPLAGAQLVLSIAGAPFTLLDEAMPHLTPEERKILAKTSPGWEKTEAGAELLGKIAPFLIPFGAGAKAMSKGSSLTSKALGAAFGVPAALQMPEAWREAGRVSGDPNATPGEKGMAIGEAGLTTGVAGLSLGGAAMPERPTPPPLGPPLTGRQIPMPEGARPFDPLRSALPSKEVLRAIAGSDVPPTILEPQSATLEAAPGTEPKVETPAVTKSTPSPDLKAQEPEAKPAPGPATKGEKPAEPATPKPGEVERRLDSPSATKNAAKDADRQKRGLLPVLKAESTTDQITLNKANAAVDLDPSIGERIVNEINEKPRTLEDWENHVINMRWLDLRDAFNKSADAAALAYQDGRLDDLADRNSDTARLGEQLDSTERAMKAAGTKAGLALRSRKVFLNEDFTLGALERKRVAAKGGKPITDDERAELKEIADAHAKANEALKQALDRTTQSEQAARTALEDLQRKVDAEPPVPPHVRNIADKLKNYFYERGDKAFKELQGTAWSIGPELIIKLVDFGASKLVARAIDFGQWSKEMLEAFPDKVEKLTPYLKRIFDLANKSINENFWKMSGGDVLVKEQVKKVLKTAPIEERKADVIEKIKAKVEGEKFDEITNLAQKLAKLAVEKGSRGWRQVADSVHSDLKILMPDWDYRDTMDAISGHGKFSMPKKDEVSRAVADAKSQMNEVRKIQEVIAKEPVKPTGFQRGTPSDAKRRLTQIYEAAKRKFGLSVASPEIQLKSVLQSRKTYVKNRIADLQYEIDRRQRTVKAKSVSPTDPELEKMRAELAKVKEEHDAIFGDRKMTDEQKLKMAMANVERDAAEFDRRIKAGDFSVKKTSSIVETPELKVAKARRDALRDQFNELRDLDEHFQNDQAEKSLLRQKAALEKLIRDKEEKLSSGDIDPKKSQVNRPADPMLEELKQQRDALNGRLAEARKKPAKSPEERSLQSFKTRTANRIADLEEKMAKGDYSTTKREPVVLDKAAMEARAKLNQVEDKFKKGQEKLRLENLPKWQKIADSLVKWRQTFVISGPRSLFKLASAAIEGMAILPVRELSGRVINKLPGLREVAKHAPIEGGHGSFIEIESKTISETWNHLIDDFGKTVKGGSADYEKAFGGKDEVPAELQNYVGFLHKALKSPLKRNVWTRAFETQLAWGKKNGIDVRDPLVQMEYGRKALENSDFWIFQNKNVLTKAYRGALAILEQREGGKPSVGGKIASTLLKIENPVIAVPSNLVARVFEGIFGTGTGSARLAHAYAKGFENLKPEEADLILRNFKTGQIGLAFALMGVFLPKMFGGFYQPGKKRDAKDVPFGSTRIPGVGVDIPAWISDNPFLIQSQFGATIRRVSDSKFKNSNQDTKGYLYGTYAAITGAAEQQPFVREMSDVGKSFASGDPRYFLGEHARSYLVPMAFQNVAEWFDKDAQGNPIIRAPKTPTQHVEMGIPGLRNTVPVKQDKKPVKGPPLPSNKTSPARRQ